MDIFREGNILTKIPFCMPTNSVIEVEISSKRVVILNARHRRDYNLDIKE